LSETDSNSNQTTYTWGANTLTIQADNGQQIVVSLDASGSVTSASYTTAAGTRQVDYSGGDTTATVSYYPGTSDSHSVHYAYDQGSARES